MKNSEKKNCDINSGRIAAWIITIIALMLIFIIALDYYKIDGWKMVGTIFVIALAIGVVAVVIYRKQSTRIKKGRL
ncbi:MAG: hypothetical protein LUF81_04175 [Clostridiales bacterium]|nr:hypothetical protein [Clostridiales bacterium]